MSELTSSEVLSLVPQQEPMRFISDIAEMDEEHILGSYTWKPEDCVDTPGTKLVVPTFKIIEMAAQIGNVAWCIYHMARTVPVVEMKRLVGVMTSIEHGACTGLVNAGDKLECLATFGEEGFFRGNKLISEVLVRFASGSKEGQQVFSGLMSGLWVPKMSFA